MLAILRLLLPLIKAGAPLPDFRDQAAIETWLRNLSPAEAAIIYAVAQQLQVRAAAGDVIVMTQDEIGVFIAEAEEAGIPKGPFLDLLKQLLANPEFMQFLLALLAGLLTPQPPVPPAPVV
jgi:hypothetical protein